MKLFLSVAIAFVSLSCFGQTKGLNTLKQVANTLTSEPAPALNSNKPESSSTPAGQTNLAVSDPGSSSDKSKSENKTAPVPAISTPTTSGTSNLAVSDPGSSGGKGKSSSNKEVSGGATTPEPQPVKETVTPPSPK